MSPDIEKNYYSGSDSDGLFRVVQLEWLQIPPPPKIPGLINGALVSIGIAHRLEFTQIQVDEVMLCYRAKNIAHYRYRLESVLISMKRTLDDLVMSSYCMLKGDEVIATKHLLIDGFGGLFSKGVPTSTGKEILDTFFESIDEFPHVLTEVVNSYKHSYLLPEAQAMWGVDFPTVVALYAYKNDYSKKVTCHNHSLGQLLIGFNKTVERVIQLQKQYKGVSPELCDRPDD